MLTIFFTFLFFFLFVGIGHLGCRVLRISFTGRAEELAFCGALGMGLTSYAVLFVGSLGGMRAPVLMVLFAVIFAVAVIPAIRIARSTLVSVSTLLRSGVALPFLVVMAALSIAYTGVLGPEIGNDALCYHLNCPKLFLAQGRIGYIAHDPNSHYPFLLQILYGLGLVLDGPTLAKAFHWMTGLFGAIALYAFARSDVGAKGGLIAAAIFLLVPGIFNQMGIAYVDIGLASFSFLSLYALVLFFQEGKLGHAALSGCFIGFALSVKYLALVSVLLFGLVFLAFAVSRRGKDIALGTLAFGICAVLFSFFWYLKSYLVFGNPVHPFYGELFGIDFMPMEYHTYHTMGAGKGLLALLLLPWNITMHPVWFEDFVAQIGPVFLAFAPALALQRTWPLRWKVAAFYVLGCTLIWFFMGQNMRFWYPALPCLAALTAWGVASLARIDGRWARNVYRLLLLFLAAELAMGAYHYRASLGTFWSPARAEQYLTETERTYEIAQWVNKNLPPDAKILCADETHGFYFHRPMTRESYYRRRTKYDEKATSPQEVLARFRKEGFTHVLQAITIHSAVMQETLSPLRLEKILQDPAQRDRHFRLLHRQRFESRSGEKAEYFVYEIQ